MISSHLFVRYLLHELALVRAALVTVSHLLELTLHVPLHDVLDRLHHQGVHLGEELKLHVLLDLLQIFHFYFLLVVGLLQVVTD